MRIRIRYEGGKGGARQERQCVGCMHEERRRTGVVERWAPAPAARLLWMLLLLLKPLLLLEMLLLLGGEDARGLLHTDRLCPTPSTGNRESRESLPPHKAP